MDDSTSALARDQAMEAGDDREPTPPAIRLREPGPFKDLPAAARRALKALEIAVEAGGGDPREHEACCQLREALAADAEIRSSRRADGIAAILFRETIQALTEQRGLVVAFELATTNVQGCEGARFLCTVTGDRDGFEWVGGGDDLPAALAAAGSLAAGRG